jgi:hypothetical protein
MPRPRPCASHALTLIGLCAFATLAAACGTPHIKLPSGPGTLAPDSVAAYTDAVRECRGVQTMSASLSLSGRAGTTKVAARIDAGFAAPARLRLEGFPRIAFGGKPFFVLVASGTDATLVLTRDGRVLRGAAPSAIVEALTGVALDPDEMRAMFSGCGVAAGQAADGRSLEHGWTSVQVGGATVFLRRIDNRWRVAGIRRGTLLMDYSEFTAGRPALVRLHNSPSPGTVAADLSIRISQVETNTTLAPDVFSVDIPKDAVPLTLEELRRAGPLGDVEKTKDVPDHNEGTEIRRTNGEEDAPGHPFTLSDSRSEWMAGRIFSSFDLRLLRSSVVIRNRFLRLLRPLQLP